MKRKEPGVAVGTTEAGALLARLQRQAARLVSQWDPSSRKGYLKTHAAFLSFFQSQRVIDRNTVILGASLVYSWMPTMLTLDLDGLDQSAAILGRIRSGAEPSDAELTHLKRQSTTPSSGPRKCSTLLPRRECLFGIVGCAASWDGLSHESQAFRHTSDTERWPWRSQE